MSSTQMSQAIRAELLKMAAGKMTRKQKILAGGAPPQAAFQPPAPEKLEAEVAQALTAPPKPHITADTLPASVRGVSRIPKGSRVTGPTSEGGYYAGEGVGTVESFRRKLPPGGPSVPPAAPVQHHDLAAAITKRRGSPSAHTSGRPFDAVAEKFVEDPAASFKAEVSEAARAEAKRAAEVPLHSEALRMLRTGGLAAGGSILAALTAEPAINKAKQLVRAKQSVMGHIMGHGGPFHTALGYGAAGAALGGGLYLANKAISGVTEPIHKERAFTRMVAEHPHLKHEDAKTVTRAFDTLWHFNPDMAKDPTVASSFVRRAAMFKDEGIQATDVKTLADIRKAMTDAKPKGGGFQEHAKFMNAFSGGLGSGGSDK